MKNNNPQRFTELHEKIERISDFAAKVVYFYCSSRVTLRHKGEERHRDTVLEVLKMTKKDIILAALSPAKESRYTPVQVQKLLFLIDKQIPRLVGGPIFDFKPYNYGPFDKSVYEEITALANDGYIDIISENTWQCYRLTNIGQTKGEQLFRALDEVAQSYVAKASEFVRALTFSELVSAIYKAYPEMRQNSVFQDSK